MPDSTRGGGYILKEKSSGKGGNNLNCIIRSFTSVLL